MKKLFAILILFSIYSTIKIPFIDRDIEWGFDFNSFIEKLKSKIPDYIRNIQKELEKFKTYANDKKDQIIKKVTEEAKEQYEKIKEDPLEYFKPIAEKTTEAANYLQQRVCDVINNAEYEECRKSKKAMFKQMYGYVKDNFQCSRIVNIITNVDKNNIEQNLKYVLFLLSAMTGNPDSVTRIEAQAMYDAMNCLEVKFNEYWPKIQAELTDETKKIELKQDITNLMIQSYSNLINMIHFEEIDEMIKKANDKTGLISDENAKKIHQGLFKVLSKLNEFGNKFYNYTANLALEVYVNPGNLEIGGDTEVLFKNLEEKGIRISIHANYLLRKYGASSLQYVIFDSPLVSVRGSRETEGGTANTFVGITLYDKEGKEVFVKDIDIKDFKPIIYYKKKLFNAMKTCLFYNEEKDTLENTGVETQTEIINGEEFIKCIPQHLTSFTIGSYEKANVSPSNAGTIVLVIVLILIALALLVGGYIFYRKKFNNVDNSQLEQAFVNKNGLTA
jgi:hypothetical protein